MGSAFTTVPLVNHGGVILQRGGTLLRHIIVHIPGGHLLPRRAGRGERGGSGGGPEPRRQGLTLVNVSAQRYALCVGYTRWRQYVNGESGSG